MTTSPGLSPLSRAALAASNLAAWTPNKDAGTLAREHDAAAEAHRRAAGEDTPQRAMHEAHARTHEEAAARFRDIAARFGSGHG